MTGLSFHYLNNIIKQVHVKYGVINNKRGAQFLVPTASVIVSDVLANLFSTKRLRGEPFAVSASNFFLIWQKAGLLADNQRRSQPKTES